MAPRSTAPLLRERAPRTEPSTVRDLRDLGDLWERLPARLPADVSDRFVANGRETAEREVREEATWRLSTALEVLELDLPVAPFVGLPLLPQHMNRRAGRGSRDTTAWPASACAACACVACASLMLGQTGTRCAAVEFGYDETGQDAGSDLSSPQPPAGAMLLTRVAIPGQ